MNKKQLVSDVKDYLGLDDYKSNSVGAGSVSLFKETEIVKEEIVLSYNKYPGAFRLSPSISGWKTFKEVDKILKKYFLKSGIGYQEHTIHIASRRFENISLFDFEKSADLEKIGKELRLMIQEDILSFFSKYKTLENVHSKIIRLDNSNLAKFVTNPPHPRIMVIKKLINDSKWETYCEESILMYQEQVKGKYKAVFEPIYNFLPDLYKELQQMPTY